MPGMVPESGQKNRTFESRTADVSTKSGMYHASAPILLMTLGQPGDIRQCVCCCRRL